jgi:hypothetical protein
MPTFTDARHPDGRPPPAGAAARFEAALGRVLEALGAEPDALGAVLLGVTATPGTTPDGVHFACTWAADPQGVLAGDFGTAWQVATWAALACDPVAGVDHSYPGQGRQPHDHRPAWQAANARESARQRPAVLAALLARARAAFGRRAFALEELRAELRSPATPAPARPALAKALAELEGRRVAVEGGELALERAPGGRWAVRLVEARQHA